MPRCCTHVSTNQIVITSIAYKKWQNIPVLINNPSVKSNFGVNSSKKHSATRIEDISNTIEDLVLSDGQVNIPVAATEIGLSQMIA